MSRLSFPVLLAIGFGFAFLYVPIIVLVIYSFNESKLVAVWGGWSLKWYGELFRNEQVLDAAFLSIKVAAVSATGAAFLGTLAGLVLARFGRFRGRSLFSGLVAAPLVMPDVIIGLSLLLLFVSLAGAIGWPASRGADTITIAHITLTLSYVAVIVQSRLAGMDQSMEEAAQDLGCPPVKTFWLITVPMLAPAIVSGWLLAFTLSLDDLVIASFVTGPGATTLPMVVFSKVRLGVSPDINALATIIIVVVAVAVVTAVLISRRAERRSAPD
ncbi:MAG: ABC transporter permease subunit [Alphaproteobacteria bacterium]|nr:ABC transporter permease subunit [Alphaproteobacteria bacterium]